MALLAEVKDKGVRKRLRDSVQSARQVFGKLRIDVGDFSEDEMLASLMALSQIAELHGEQPFTYLTAELPRVRELGPRPFFAWCQQLAAEYSRARTDKSANE